ncbi:MAG: universal stress protein [Desulfohalobiaceae bacterium]|nr:universal stress protein [Desulfohalobiaceae bacterium]
MIPEIKKILFATNKGPEARHVFNYALSQALHYQAKIHVLYVVEPLPPYAQSLVEHHLTKDKAKELQEKNREEFMADFKSRLERFCGDETCKLDQGENLIEEIKLLEGRPADTIKNEAQNIGADLIVMGTHRRKLSTSGLIGSTARKVVNSSKIPVLTVYTPDDQLENTQGHSS